MNLNHFKNVRKIGMEKLIELLNEYEEYRGKVADRTEQDLISYYYIISKKFGFIKWLVEKDKIYLDNEDLVSLMSDLRERRHPVKCLLMLLSIQDNPIEFLISILK